MKIENLRYFVVVAEEGSINRAAARLHFSHQNLGFIIRSIEKEMGCDLLVRDRRGVSLTAEGERFLGYAQKIVAEWDECLREEEPERIVTLYTTSALRQLLGDMQGMRTRGGAIVSVYTYGFRELNRMIRARRPGVFFIPVLGDNEGVIAQGADFHVLMYDDMNVTICHRSNPVAGLGLAARPQDFEGQIFVTDSYEVDGSEGIVNIGDLDYCKQFMRENNALFRTTEKLYELLFPEDEWVLVERGTIERVDFGVLFCAHRYSRALKGELLEKLRQKMAVVGA